MPDHLDRTTVITAAPFVYTGVLGGQLVLFSAADRRLHVLNDTARAIWRDLGVGRTLGGLVRVVAAEHGLEAEVIAADIEALVHTLVDAGLCRLSSDESTIGDAGEPSQPPQVSAPSAARLAPNGPSIIGPIRALGAPITVETDDAFLRAELTRILDPLRPAGEDTSGKPMEAHHQHLSITALDGRWVVRRNNLKVATVPSRAAAIRAVVAECNSAPLAHLTDAVVLHAAGVDLGRGVVLFPGVSNAGKSTLAAQLLLRGHAYLSDEAMAVDLESLRARPFPKALAIDAGAQVLFPNLVGPAVDGATVDVDPRAIGPGRLSGGGPVVAIVFPRFDVDAAPGLVPLDHIGAIRQLLANTFDFDHIGKDAFDALVRLADLLPCYTLTHAGGQGHLDQLEVMFGGDQVVSL